MLIGPREERWDLCFIAAYPSVSAFVEMPTYHDAVKHRQAAVRDSRLIRLALLLSGKGFDESPGLTWPSAEWRCATYHSRPVSRARIAGQ